MPASSGAPAPPRPGSGRLRVSALVSFRWRNGRLICDDPVRHRQLAITPAAERLLRPFADWAPAEELDPPERRLAEQLLAAGVLVAEGSAEHRREEDLGSWRQIGSAALHYHLAGRTHADADFATRAEDGAALRARAGSEPSPYKDCPGEQVELPAADEMPPGPAGLLSARRSTRAFDTGRPLTAGALSTLLRWTSGVRHEVRVTGLGAALLKTTPSGGARHPLEVYPVVRRVDGLAPGVYHYSVRRHGLERIGPAPDDETVLDWCGGQGQARDAAVLLLHTAVLARTTWKYPNLRTYRAALLDLGHLSQTVYLAAAGLGLGVFFTAATRDEPVERTLGIDWTEEIFLGVSGLGMPTAAEQARQAEMLRGGAAGFSFQQETGE